VDEQIAVQVPATFLYKSAESNLAARLFAKAPAIATTNTIAKMIFFIKSVLI